MEILNSYGLYLSSCNNGKEMYVSVKLVQSCCFVYLNLLLFCCSPLMLSLLLKLSTLYLIPGGINYTKTTIAASYTTVHACCSWNPFSG